MRLEKENFIDFKVRRLEENKRIRSLLKGSYIFQLGSEKKLSYVNKTKDKVKGSKNGRVSVKSALAYAKKLSRILNK